MMAQPSMIKRPVLETAGPLTVGFRPDAYAARFGSAPLRLSRRLASFPRAFGGLTLVATIRRLRP